MGCVQRSRGRLLGEEMRETAGQSHNAYHLTECEPHMALAQSVAGWNRGCQQRRHDGAQPCRSCLFAVFLISRKVWRSVGLVSGAVS